MLKVVIDTNLFVSSIIQRSGTPAKLIQAWREHAFILVMSEHMLEEIKRVLQYPHIKNTYNLNDDEICQAIDTIKRFAVMLPDVEHLDIIKEDPDDNIIIACAVTAKADCIVSGDRHLLRLKAFKNIPIVTAKEFFDSIEV